MDGILVNRVAAAALSDIGGIEGTGSQHKPVRASFQCNILSREGFVLNKTSALDIRAVPLSSTGMTRWTLSIPPLLDLSPNSRTPLLNLSIDAKWGIVNDVCECPSCQWSCLGVRAANEGPTTHRAKSASWVSC